MAVRRLRAQLLVEPVVARPTAGGRASAVVEAVGRVLAVQAQDGRGARLAVRSRTIGLSAADVDAAFAERRLVVTWLNRGTLHLVRAEDYAWLHALTAPRQETFVRRRLGEEGVSPADAERGIALIERALADEGPLTRVRLRDLLVAAGVPVAGQALIMILAFASLRGVLVRGPMAGAEHAYALTRDWLGDLAAPDGPGFDRDAALTELATRYLAGHGPADDRDLAAWTGLTLRDARRGLSLAAAAGAIESFDDGRADLRTRPAGDGDTSGDEAILDDVPSRLLGPFDPVLHGWASRDWVTGPHRGIVTVNGIFRAIALVAGQAAGTWTMPSGQVSLSLFAPLPPAAEAALAAQAIEVERFFAAPQSTGSDAADEARGATSG